MDLSAGDVSEWLAGMQRALRGVAPSEVACGECTACCTSSQFIHVEPDETETLALFRPSFCSRHRGCPKVSY